MVSSTTSSAAAAAARRAHRTTRQRAMYRRRRLAVSGLALVVIGVLTLGFQGAQALISGLTSSASAADDAAGTDLAASLAAADTPVELELESAAISVPLSGAGLDEDGEIDPPQGAVTWYTGHDRVTPGDLGTAVIAGHVNYDGAPDTFAQLSSVTKGDRLTITFGDGVRLETEIVSTHLISKDELQGSDLVWGDQKTKRRIAIVTCDEVLGEDGHREGNFVALAELG